MLIIRPSSQTRAQSLGEAVTSLLSDMMHFSPRSAASPKISCHPTLEQSPWLCMESTGRAWGRGQEAGGREEATAIIRPETAQPGQEGLWETERDSRREPRAELQGRGPRWAARVIALSGKCWPSL